MTKKTSWLALIGLVVFSLLIAACAPAAPTTTTSPTPTTPTLPTPLASPTAPTAPTTPTTPSVQKPKYGGQLNLYVKRDIIYWDDVVGRLNISPIPQLVYEELLEGDWAKGPAGGYGTNETGWTVVNDRWNLKTGRIAESWEIPNKIEGDRAAFIFRIRKGIRWALNPNSEASRLMGGRELTTEDVVATLADQKMKPYFYSPDLKAAKVTSPAPWTVKIEVPWESFESAFGRFSDFAWIHPPEVVKKYGNITDWKNVVGTGPFMLTDFVKGSSVTLIRNPNYWDKDPIGPGKGNQLPYLDTIKGLIIPDQSTVFAAFRTGKIDMLDEIGWEESANFKKQVPQLKSVSQPPTGSGTYAAAWRTDKPPYNDVRVRRALMMAIDFESIRDKYFGGKAQILTFPIPYQDAYAGAYLGLDDAEMPASVKELYTYNPEKAKALLKEAGYPNGFKTWIETRTELNAVDYYSIIKDMWSKVGVQLDIKPLENAAWEAWQGNRSYQQILGTAGFGSTILLYRMPWFVPNAIPNRSMVDDPVINDAYSRIQRALVTSQADADRIHKDLMKHALNQVYALPGVAPYTEVFWWPWLKNYSGEQQLGYQSYTWPTFVWYDQELKKSMGY